MNQIIIHVDMDAFYASVEVRDNPHLRGRPLIIGSLPTERGVVATCSYEARKYGVHSAMNIKEAYHLCPGGIYMHPNFDKYKAVSRELHKIWNTYADAAESIALDEAYLDVTLSAGSWEKAREIARTIKQRTRQELHLTCSVGLGYSKTAAKTASEEKKPDGYYEIPDAQAFIALMSGRDVRSLYTVGEKTAEKLHKAGIQTVRDIRERAGEVIRMLGKHGEWLVSLSEGRDERRVIAYNPQDAKSISREITFQENVDSTSFLKEVLLLLSLCVENRAERVGLYGEGVTLKITYADMKTITRSRTIASTRSAHVIYRECTQMLDQIPHHPIRLVGAGLTRLSGDENRQLRLLDVFGVEEQERTKAITEALSALASHYNLDFAGHLDQIFRSDTLYRTIEYMRKWTKVKG